MTKKLNTTPKRTPAYPLEFKQNAVARVAAGENAADVARDLKVHYVTLRSWIKPLTGRPTIQAQAQVVKTPKVEVKKEEVKPSEKIPNAKTDAEIARYKDQLLESRKEIERMRDHMRKLESFIIHKVVDEDFIPFNKVNGYSGDASSLTVH